VKARNLALVLGISFITALGVIPLAYLLALVVGFDPLYKSNSSISEAIYTILNDRASYSSLIRSIVYAALTSSIQFSLALFLSRIIFSGKLVATRYLYLLVLPLGITPIAASLMWKSLFDYQFGPLNALLSWVGVGRLPWLSTTPLIPGDSATGFSEFNWGQLSVFLTDCWLWIPFLLGAILLACSRVPTELLESASLEEARAGRVFWNIVFPLSRPYLLLLFFLRLVDSFRFFDTDWAFFGSSPVATHLSARVYSQMFLERDYTLSATLAIVGAIIISPVSGLLLSRIRKAMMSVT
jgi:multiple sugar transport system permease protein